MMWLGVHRAAPLIRYHASKQQYEALTARIPNKPSLYEVSNHSRVHP